MPILSLLLGILFLDAGVRHNAKDVFEQLRSDAQGFLAFGAAIIILAIIGSVDTFRPITKALLVLLFVVFLLKNGNAVVKGLTNSASAMPEVDMGKGGSDWGASESNQKAADNAGEIVNLFGKIAPLFLE